MAASSDPDDYGELEVFEMPRTVAGGPGHRGLEHRVGLRRSRPSSRLLDQQGSNVGWATCCWSRSRSRLLYVRPLYTQASGATAVPELKKVIVTFNGNSYMRDTLPEALIAAFGEAPPVEPEPGEGETETPPDEGGDDGGTTTPPVSGSVADLLAQADEKFTEAEQALRDGDLAAYQLAIDEARDLVAEAAEAAGQEADGATTTSTTATSSTTTSVASA